MKEREKQKLQAQKQEKMKHQKINRYSTRRKVENIN